MQAVILSAGKGTRLPEISKVVPKVMVLINKKPLLQWHIENLREQDITDISINLHYLPKKITEYFGDGKQFGVTITYSHEKELLGTGGALLPLVNRLTDNTLIIYGDVVSKINFRKLLSFHKKNQALITAMVQSSSHPEDSDLVDFNDHFQITKILKKPHATIPKNPHNLAALYLFSPKVFTYLPKDTPYDIAQDLLPIILKKNERILAYRTSEFLMDIGTPARLEKARRLLDKIY